MEENKIIWPIGTHIRVSGDSADLELEDYNIRVDTEGMLIDPVFEGDETVLATLDYIDGDSNVTAHLPINKVYFD